jgi:hypothetical protein
MREASSWNDMISRTLTIYANLIFLVLWVGFVTALVVNRAWLDEIWSWVHALPTVPRIVVTVLFLPVVAGLWIWESSWSTPGRVLGPAGMIAWTLLAVYSLLKYHR